MAKKSTLPHKPQPKLYKLFNDRKIGDAVTSKELAAVSPNTNVIMALRKMGVIKSQERGWHSVEKFQYNSEDEFSKALSITLRKFYADYAKNKSGSVTKTRISRTPKTQSQERTTSVSVASVASKPIQKEILILTKQIRTSLDYRDRLLSALKILDPAGARELSASLKA